MGKQIFLLFSFLMMGCGNQPKEAGDVIAKDGMVVTAHPEATRVGVEILRRGGNAVDAAIAVQFALAVVYPGAGNIGGGGLMVLREADGRIATLDFREKAPAGATEKMYLDTAGNPIENLSTKGHCAVGVPGSVDGMVSVHKKFGSMKFADLVQPAIDLARKGFRLTKNEAQKYALHQEDFRKYNTIQPSLLKEDVWKENDLVVQEDLAGALERIRDYGREGFYAGKTADDIVQEMKRGGGLITHEDLQNYHSVWREPVTGAYKGYRIISMAPPSSGGIALLQLLQSVEKYPLKEWGWNTVQTVHLMTEAERRVYADRASHLGDPDFYRVPVKTLLKPEYNAARMKDFSADRATPSKAISAGDTDHESTETTHFSIVDRWGNAVAITTTLNGSFGSSVFVGGSGFILNNEMDDFSIKPGVPNMYGLVGNGANAIAPGKRMLSSMTPTILEKDGRLFMVVGTPGGSTIITSVFQTILNVIEFDMSMRDAVYARRFHHQWLPDKIFYEHGTLNEKVIATLRAMGHTMEEREPIGRVDAILVRADGQLEGGADPRGDDRAEGYTR